MVLLLLWYNHSLSVLLVLGMIRLGSGPDYGHNLRGAITFIEAFSPKTISFFSSDLLICNKYKLK